MSFRSFQSKTIADPRGAWLDLAGIESRPNRASLARNMRFSTGKAYSRFGYAQGLAVDAKITSMYNWITGSIQRLVRYRNLNNVEMVDLSNDAVTALYTITARALSVAEAATRVYIAGYTSANVAAGQARVVNALVGGVPVDKAFAGPMTQTTITISDLGAGNVTAGSHQFGYIMESRTGFVGKLGPVNGVSGVFTPTTYVVAAGTGRSLNMAVTANIPVDAAYAHAIMTRIDNPVDWYFVPGGSVAIPGGAVGWTFNIAINYSDTVLAAAAANLATNNQYYLTQDVSGNGPISPSAIFSYGRRLVYIVDTKAYFSDINDFQAIAEDRNAVEVEGQRKLTQGMSIRGVAYLFGPNWVYSIQDNSDYPATWAQPKLVSSGIGIRAPGCICPSTTGHYGWVASEPGFYFFDGQFDDKPVNYLQLGDWDRVNWAAAATIQIVDNPIERIVYVLVPLDGATEPNYLMTFDYSRARSSLGRIDPMAVDYSLDDYNNAASISSIALVQDYTTGERGIWIGPAAAGNILKQSFSARNDNTVPIHPVWETGLVLVQGDRREQLNVFAGMHADVIGSGNLLVTAYGLQRVKSVGPFSIALAAAPGTELYKRWDLQPHENESIRLETNALGAWFEFSTITPYWKGKGTNR